MKKQVAILLGVVAIASCAFTPSAGNRSLEREGEVFAQLQELTRQLQAEGRMDPTLMEETVQQLRVQESWLGLGDYYYLEGTQYYLSMAAGGMDKANYERAKSSLALSAEYFHDLNERWLEAQSTWMLALTNMRAENPEETCAYYHKTLKLLNKPKGQLKEFKYEHDKFDAPQSYIKGVLGDACAIYETQKVVAKNSQ